ncbi:WUSCHEL-related homeobox 11-like isoform X2 [Hevea brasiliensis]|uniref:WUSCHEL-related homeobox 11-like isoform X2 n=1 Tax=Hevea brasiliensis TaxID=3981 RepID=UPI0025E650CD|nr:WUSCHEL-related homeobox 11-like isoform X2 [Hevea brasiliensis]
MCLFCFYYLLNLGLASKTFLFFSFLFFSFFSVMEDNHPNSPGHHGTERSEPVRSRWTPKPEQILILESIFNSGMVNPPKDETVRIRKLLEKFGSVGDANVFYWFQNRRSRSRRRQRQMQATLAEEQRNQQAQASASVIQYEGGSGGGSSSSLMGFANSPSFAVSPSYLVGSSSSCGVVGHGDGVESLFSIPNQMGFQEIEQGSGISSILCPSQTSNLHYQAGFITVFINGVPTEVPRGPLDMKAMFGQDVMLVHSSGLPVPSNEYGFLMQSLQHGESYFLVSRPT